ncbi:SseB family protein [Leifsonia sp. AG29]|uniref:SseB family protein n=1 Tax=Leifsonia sp. AG29 TaxID=2598860 RepID=UPI00131A6D2D|nr:SseB family protein [Leifsonia sp. AG29]
MSPGADAGSEGARERPRPGAPSASGADRLAGFAASLAADAARAADSAGQPWAGREFDDNPFGDDDGAAPPELLVALAAFRRGQAGPEAVVDALRGARLLVPLIAELGEEGTTAAGHAVDKSQELSLVTVAGPDGRTVQPVFSSVAALQNWNPSARPVPVGARRVALAAVSEGVELLVLDPTSETEFVVRRPAVWAMAQGASWLPPQADPLVVGAFRASIAPELGVQAVDLAAGDPDQRLVAEELIVRLSLSRGLSEEALGAILSRLAQRWAADDAIATRVDSLRVQLAAAPD